MNEWKHQRLLSNSLHLSMTPLCTAFTLFPSSVLCCSQKQQQPQAYDGSVISCDAACECSAASTIIAPPTIKSTHILYYSRIVPNRPKNFLLTCYVKTATSFSITFFSVNTRRIYLLHQTLLSCVAGNHQPQKE